MLLGFDRILVECGLCQTLVSATSFELSRGPVYCSACSCSIAVGLKYAGPSNDRDACIRYSQGLC